MSLHRLRSVKPQRNRRLTPDEKLIAAENERAKLHSLTYAQRLMRISSVRRWGTLFPYTKI
jgi:hypothetical protein